MLRLANTAERYGVVGVLLHWGMAVLLVALLAMGWYMVQLPDAGFDRQKISLILAHKSIGMFALAAVGLRMAWRSASVLPGLAPSLPDWQQVAARFVHLCFYGVMLALPLTGWLMSSAGGYPVYVLFDRVALPDLIALNPYHFELLIHIHRWFAYVLAGLVALHAGAALRHHFVLRDDTLRKMLP